jgi:hypothetical protein
MTSFAFNTMIGQVTSPAMANVGYKYYYLFIVCDTFPIACTTFHANYPQC